MARQPAQAGQRTYSVPWMACSAYEQGLARGQEPALFFSMSSNPLLARSLNFTGSSVFFGSFTKLAKYTVSGLRAHCLGTGCESVIGW